MLFYLQGPFLLHTLSAKGGRRTISLQAYSFKLIINCRALHAGCVQTPFWWIQGASACLASLIPRHGIPAGWTVAFGKEKRQDADLGCGLQRQAIPMEANLKLKTRLSI